jgi:hypothetical protein
LSGCACALAGAVSLVLPAAAPAARTRACTLFDFGRPNGAVPGFRFSYDPTGFLWDGSNGWIRQGVAPDRAVVDPHVKLVPHMRTIRLEVRPGDRVGSDVNERADVYYGGEADPSPPGPLGIREGATQWWAWSTKTATTFSPGPAWNIIMDFHSSGPAPSANVMVSVLGTHLVFDVYGGQVTDPAWVKRGAHRVAAPFVAGKRYDFALGVHWSSVPRKGWAVLWVNGRRAAAALHVPTLWQGQSVYPKLADYRPRGVAAWPNVVWHAGFRRGPTHAAVSRCLR